MTEVTLAPHARCLQMKKSSSAQTVQARRLADLIEDEGTKVDELAARCHMPPEKIRSVLDDHLPVDLQTLYAIAHYTSASLDYLTRLTVLPMRYPRGDDLAEDEKEFLKGVREIQYQYGPIGLRFVKALLRHLQKESEIEAQAQNLVAI